MNYLINSYKSIINLLIFLGVTILIISTVGCSGFSNQIKATREGIKINYHVNKEQINPPSLPMVIKVIDERMDKEVIGKYAEESSGSKFMGYFTFGLLYSIKSFDKEPVIQDRSRLNDMFLTSFRERFSHNGVLIVSDPKDKHYAFEVEIRIFSLNFHSSDWIGEVGYIARVKENSNIVCKQVIKKKIMKYNMWGFGTAEEAISEAFESSINKFDLNQCFQEAGI